jgi:hypothetical protein
VIAGLLLAATPSSACSCVGNTPAELAATAEVIFTGIARAYGLPPGQAPTRNDEALQLSIVAAVALITLGVISLVSAPRRLAS